MGVVAKSISLKLLKRIPSPIYRWDIWPFVLVFYPSFFYIAARTWEAWHPSEESILSTVTVFGPLDGFEETSACPYIESFFQLAAQLPPAVPLLAPFHSLPVEILEPLLHSHNFGLLLKATGVFLTVLLGLAFLLPFWSPAYKAWALYVQANNLEDATHIFVKSSVARSAFCPLEIGYRFTEKQDLKQVTQISYLKKSFHVVHADQLGHTNEKRCQHRLKRYRTVGKCAKRPLCLLPPQYGTDLPMSFYAAQLKDLAGIPSREQVKRTRTVFGLNQQEIPIPSFLELFGEHAVQPLFVFQIFCLLLWLMDDYWQHSLMTVGILLLFEGQLVHRRRKDLGMIKGMHMPPIPLAVRRGGKWYKISSSDLLPGDLFSLASGNDLKALSAYPDSMPIPLSRFNSQDNSIAVPCDALILRGGAVANEAMLTGESLPQMKSAVDFVETPLDETLDMNGKHKNSSLFAGTSILMETSGEGEDFEESIGGAICYCLRSGFQTTQGKLIRTVLFASERATASSGEAILFLLILMVVALVASGYVLYKSWGLPNRNHYKLLLHCVMILTSVVPPELPVTMSLTVTLALNVLFKKKLFCTEPFRIPAAGKLTYCCFDKTGTLTTSEVVLERIVGIPRNVTLDFNRADPSVLDDALNDDENPHVNSALPEATKLTMGLCHSLISVIKKNRLPLAMRSGHNDGKTEYQIFGDPLEKTTCQTSRWIPSPSNPNVLSCETPLKQRAEILRRFPFVSAAQRMTVVARVEDGDGAARYFVLCKGAAERVATLITHKPSWYDAKIKSLASEGRRVLALAAKEYIGSPDLIAKSTREDLEEAMHFCGLLVFGCPIKPKTNETLETLRESGHSLVMITGDDPRTAAYIAIETGLINPHKPVWFVEGFDQGRLKLVSRHSDVETHVPLDGSVGKFTRANALCLTGVTLEHLSTVEAKQLIPHVAIFARVTPPEKEYVLRTLSNLGEATLMCGDGTNDVGALKAADVGISLLNFDIDKIKKIRKEQLEKVNTPSSLRESSQDSRKRRLDLGLTAKQIEYLEKLEATANSQEKAMAAFPASWTSKMIAMSRKNIAVLEDRYAQDNLAVAAGHKPTSVPPTTDPLDSVIDETHLLKPGDASMASPFTYRGQNIKCVKLLVRSGKATLATVMMMYKLMALNSLTTAFSLSILTMNGVKFGDLQATLESLFISVLFMAASNAKTSKALTKDRVIDSLFSFYFYMSIVGQTIVHVVTCGLAWYMAQSHMPASREMDGPFKPNIVNTVIWLLNASQHVTTFTANYEGMPFLVDLGTNKVLGRGIKLFICILLLIAFEWVPMINKGLALVPMPSNQFKWSIVLLIVTDLVGASLIGRLCMRFGRERMTRIVSRT